MKFDICTEKELWEYVAVALAKAGIQSTLVGGAVAAIYSNGAYRSGDLDIVVENYIQTSELIEKAMRSINFEKNGRHWIHKDCKHLYVEFVKPPVAIGDDYSIKPIEIAIADVTIKIISPVDCVKDRLCSYVYFKARECLDQAYLVASSNEIDENNLNKWAKSEGKEMVQAVKDLKEKLEANNRCN